jgi:hypothetical protein
MIIGSYALKHHFPEFKREPKDYDIVAFDEYDKLDLIRIHKGTPGLKLEVLVNPIILNYYKKKGGIPAICGKDELYTLKMSHLFWDVNWEKHEWDATFLREKGCKLIKPLFDDLYEYWNEFHGKNKRSDLKMTASEFFNNALNCPYDHDWLHTLLNPIPTFNKVLKDGEEVEVSEEKFNLLSEEEKEDLVREEVEIMAFERWPKLNFRMAYGIMLKKFIISHAPIWEAIYILENYKKLCRAKHNFIKYLNEKINERGNNSIKRSSRFIDKQIEV